MDEVAGALRPRIEVLEPGDVEGDAEAYGPFRDERDAWRALEGKAREAQLCFKVLGLEQGEGSCFASQLGRCRGACAGREPLPMHDARLRLALASLRIQPWPFRGAVGIRERAPGGEGSILHVIDRWQHLGTASHEGEIDSLLRAQAEAGFDADSYRILRRCLGRVAPRDIVVLDHGAHGGD